MAIARPPQTRGFLFADLRGYSAFTERHGDQAARKLLARYRRLVRDVIATFGGAEIRTEGDSFYIVFDSVSRAVDAGMAILSAAAEPDPDPAGHPIAVGIGIHAGETEDSAEGIVSGAVNTAARICAQAQPGELLVSDTVRSLTRTYLDLTFVPRGTRRLKGIAEPMAMFSVHPHTDGPAVSANYGWRRSPRMAMIAGSTAIIAVMLAAAWTVQPREEEGTRLASLRPTTGAPASGSPAPESTATHVVDLDTFPNSAEEGLLEHLAVDHRDRCERALVRDAPHLWVRGRWPGGRVDTTPPWLIESVPNQGSITCRLGRSVGPDTVWYWHIEASTQPVELIHNHAGRFNVYPGGEGCARSHRALEEWAFGTTEGLLLCYTSSDGDAIIEWGYDGGAAFGKAVRRDGDMATLLGWWTANARFAP